MKKYYLVILCSLAAMLPLQEMHASISNTTAALIGFGTSALTASGTAYYFNKQLKEKEWQIQKQKALLKFNNYLDDILFGNKHNSSKEYIADAHPYYLTLLPSKPNEQNKIECIYIVQVDEKGVGGGVLVDKESDFLELKIEFLTGIEKSMDYLKKKHNLPQ